MKIYIERENKEIEKDFNEISIENLLKKLNISKNSVIVIKNGNICIEDEMVSNEDRIEILSVVSGG